MRNPINHLVGEHVARLKRKERDGKPPPKLSGRSATRLWYLRRAALLRTFSREQIEALAEASELRQLARRDLNRFPRLRRWEQTDDVLQNATLRLLRAST